MKSSRLRNAAVFLIALFLAYAAGPALAADGGGSHGSKVTIPATTSLTVKLDQIVSANTAESGGGFTVTISEPVKVDGSIVIPAGATGAGVVSRSSQGGAEMELNSVFVNGRSYRVTTSPITFSQKGALRAGTKFTFDLVLSLSVVE